MTVIIEKDDHVRGSGPVTVLVYGDYECPYVPWSWSSGSS